MESIKKFQGPVTDFIDRLIVRVDEIQSAANGRLEKTDIRKHQGALCIKKCDSIQCAFSVCSHQIIDLIIVKLTEQNSLHTNRFAQDHMVAIPILFIMDCLGIPHTKASRDNTVKRLKKEMDLLSKISIEWEETENNKGTLTRKKYTYVRLIDEYSIRKGTLIVRVSPEFADRLINSYVMEFPLWILKLDKRNPNLYFIGKKFAIHSGMKNNVKKGSDGCISVRALLDAVPTIPTIDEVDICDPGHWSRRILEPLEKALKQLSKNGFIEWSYCGRGQSKIDSDDLERYRSNAYSYRDLYIKFEMK